MEYVRQPAADPSPHRRGGGECAVDQPDARQFRHRAQMYRRTLAECFTEVGGGVWLSHHAEVPLFALEHAGPP